MDGAKFNLEDGATLEDFEKALFSLANDAPVNLASLSAAVKNRDINLRWTGHLSDGVKLAGKLGRVALAREAHRKTVSYLILRSRQGDVEYLKNCKGLIPPVVIIEERKKLFNDLGEVAKERMRNWVLQEENKGLIENLKEQLSERAMSLIDVGKTSFAEKYRADVFQKQNRETAQGEIKAVLSCVADLVINRTKCGLKSKFEPYDKGYWGDAGGGRHDDSRGSGIGSRGEFRIGGLRVEGWIDNLVFARKRLQELSGSRRIDFARLSNFIDDQKGYDKIYKTFDGGDATLTTADLKIFDTGLRFANSGEKILARFHRVTKTKWRGVDWVAPNQIGIKASDLVNAESLYCQVFMGESWIDDLKHNVNLQEEEWTVDKRFPDGVLKQYMRLTYFKLRQQNKIFTKPGVCQIFNTGLVDRSYNPIYAYLIPDERRLQPWRYKCFGYPMDSTPQGRMISANLGADLPKAEWFKKIDDLYFDPAIQVVPNYAHCMIENAMRVPRYLIKHVILDDAVSERTIRFLDEMEAVTSEDRDFGDIASKYGAIASKYLGSADVDSGNVDVCDPQEIVGAYFKSLPNYANILRNLSNKLDSAIALAKKMVANDYTAAVPMYYPAKGSFALLLPLAFYDPMKVDCALVVEKNEGGRYEGTTILTKQMAYADARLLRRPDTQWIVRQ